MGEHAIRKAADQEEARSFTRAVLRDIRALEALIAADKIETGITRAGAEQEMYLVDADCRPAPYAHEVLARIDDPHFTTELARFNLEANFAPRKIGGNFLAELEKDLVTALAKVERCASKFGARVLLTGILPTLRTEDLGICNLTPDLRYQYLNEALFQGRDAITIVIDGIENYEGSYDSVALEGANTSLQLHLQVTPENAATTYNLMQLITAPLLAAATNSPVLLGRRLWYETRIAVFERALDKRSGAQLARGFPGRVTFGDSWLKESILEIFKDNAARFPVILTRDLDEDSVAVVAEGRTPALSALSLHNGTVWRWNRPCYGVKDGIAHLRIENRALPAGPSIIDEVANAALFYGMMSALPPLYGDVTQGLPFADAKCNFVAAARYGLGAEFIWLDRRPRDARSLLLDELIPAARKGLDILNVPPEQIDRYLGVVEARVTSGRTGASWLLDTFHSNRDRDPATVWKKAVDTMLVEQHSGQPVHEWRLPDAGAASPATTLKIAEIMTTDLFTLRPDDVIDLASSVMEWKHIRHIPVESESGELLGVVTARDLVSSASRESKGDGSSVKAFMHSDLVRIQPETNLNDALAAILGSDHGCLMVVSRERLIGIVTERDLLRAAANLLSPQPIMPES